MGAAVSHLVWSQHWTHSGIVRLPPPLRRRLRGKRYAFSECQVHGAHHFTHHHHNHHHGRSTAVAGGGQVHPAAFDGDGAVQTTVTQSPEKCTCGKPSTVDAFLGIPYARPPVGSLRFQKPQPPVDDDAVLECTRFGPRCPHEDLPTERLAGLFHVKDEDCLRLNVFAPTDGVASEQTTDATESTWRSKKRAVMVFIHGGGFVVHSAAHYGDYGICKNLCLKDVVVVTIQYRLGFFGFLCTDDDVAPGNIGLWDQAMALRWVRDNISAFGGDPSNVTVFGQSAGAASTDLLALSPHTRDLFDKMIVMSGSASCTFATSESAHLRQVCRDFAIQCGFVPTEGASKREESEALLEFFRQLPASALELGFLGKRGFKVNKNGKLDLTPVIDGDFLPKPIAELRRDAPHKKVITGIAEFESLLFTAISPPKGSLREEVRKVLTREFEQRGMRLTPAAQDRVAELYHEKADADNHKKMTEACVKIASDVLLVNGIWDFADTMTRLGHTVYLYSFNYFNWRSFGVAGILFPFKGATHCSELPYLFHKGIVGSFLPTHDDLEFSHHFSTLFTNFAKYGNPNGQSTGQSNGSTEHGSESVNGSGKTGEESVEVAENSPHYWQPLSADDTLRYYRIDLHDMRMAHDDFCGGRPAVWRDEIFRAEEVREEDVKRVVAPKTDGGGEMET